MAGYILVTGSNMGEKHGRGIEKFESGAIYKGDFWNDSIWLWTWSLDLGQWLAL
jgi:hypothetical protein